ncbi:hypothetical protein PHISP_04065 [Aspergillus sp. HF37]|nr:hypothetical protein PHISP_04065 [Aspergillus sp. HF37]
MCVDVEQSLDSLVGLHNKILLVDANAKNRVILVPEGEVSWARIGDHIGVEIGWQPTTTVHAYSIDRENGRLADNGSLQSKLFLCYLHALTSFCLPDPLIEKTGTEQALSILRSASMRSFDQLRPENSAILENIATLTPERRYYPEHERVMQNVRWLDDLGFMSHHGGFYKEVAAISEQDVHVGLFYPDSKPRHQSLPKVERNLLRRDLVRSSSLRVSGFGAEDYTHEYDTHYVGRGSRRDSPALQVFALCKILHEEIPRAREITPEILLTRLWEFLSGPNLVNGPDVKIDATSMRYDAKLMLNPSELIASNWCRIHRLVSSRMPRFNKFQLMIWLSAVAFSETVDMVVLEAIASLYVVPEMASILPPRRPSFEPRKGYQINESVLQCQIKPLPLEKTPESHLSPKEHESYSQFIGRQSRAMKRNQDLALQKLITHLKRKWPDRNPSHPSRLGGPDVNDYVDMQKSMTNIHGLFSEWCSNRELRLYLFDVATLFGQQIVELIENPPPPVSSQTRTVQRRRGFICFDDLLGPPPTFDMQKPQLPDVLRATWQDEEPASQTMDLVGTLQSQAKSNYEEWYVRQLQNSAASLQKRREAILIGTNDDDLEEAITGYLSLCRQYSQYIFQTVISRMTPSEGVAGEPGPLEVTQAKVVDLLASVNQWPRLSPSLLHEQLTRHRWPRISNDWKRTFIAYGISKSTLQWAERLAGLLNDRDELLRELRNPGHTTWDPFEHPESLLLEIENGILIREVQDQIARQMRSSDSGRNTVMQLNMGEGKSSIIVPIVAASLANSSCLVRVVVAKPQSRQMFQMLVSKLGGLLGRRIYHMPVSRSLKLGEAEADEIGRMCRECMLHGGVLLVQPEHLLSLKLMCLECFISGRSAVGTSLLRTLQFFHTSARDVVDESDENFNVKFELIYTMGTQRPVELSPQRWVLIQQVLELMRRHAPCVKDELPRAIELDEQQSGTKFPRIRLLHRDSEQALFERIATDICDSGIESLPISRQPRRTREAVFTYMVKSDLTAAEIDAVENDDPAGLWTESTKSPLLLLRGLLAGGVLGFCFGQKRWRVHYGPDQSRCPPTKLCVPYRAKDNPSPRSEFSHPDVVIVLTSLNYYYSGIDDCDLFRAFNHLVKTDQADTEYQAWVNDAPTLPPEYRQLVGINLEDRQECTNRVFPGLRFCKVAIDYFLAKCVFPKEMKEFPDKLSASGWDIGETKSHPSSGFSGTNDSRETLPLNVRQLDLPEQMHTNALVLKYLLQPENSVSFVRDQHTTSASDAEQLLGLVANLDPPAQVILDVGAQILELSNVQVAQHWLNMLPEDGSIRAIVFVNDSDEICVLDRIGRVELLQISSFARQMEACVVFLDEAHTRGIDLKLPRTYRAAVTLGAGITKDKLVQACMRMRKLGNGQSVVFCIPEEITFSILTLTGKKSKTEIGVSDVLRWAVSETWVDARRSMPLWAAQGRRFERQTALWRNAHEDDSGEMSIGQAEGFLEPECQTLEQRYRPGHGEKLESDSFANGNANLRCITDRCRKFEDLNHVSSTLQEEQERELAPEIESERQVQRPPTAVPEKHRLHPHLRTFVATGYLPNSSNAYMPAFHALRSTSAASFLGVSQFPSGVLVTKDFATTIQMPKGSRFISDAFQRPVQWILTSSTGIYRMVVISPYEANCLLPEIRESSFVTLHLYAPRQNQGCKPLDNLMLYNVPRSINTIETPDSLRIQLNLFAGQLYLSSYAEYQRVCELLGVASGTTRDGQVVAADGFIVQGNEGTTTTFRQSPLKFLKVLMSQIRKDCQEVDKTHIGRIVDGRLLSPSDFELRD